MKNLTKKLLGLAVLTMTCLTFASANNNLAMQNVMNRERMSLNGKWATLPDIMEVGAKANWGNPKPPTDKLKLQELQYDGGMTLDVPGDWNSQNPEFVYFESYMWYKRSFYFTPNGEKRNFLHFAAVANHANVYLNGELLGKHHGGFTPFQFEVTDRLKNGENIVVVRVDNIRGKNTIPALKFDWWNYGGITRDVDLISTPKTFIEDYWVRLAKGSTTKVLVDVELNGADKADQEVEVTIAGTKISKKIKTDANGVAKVEFDAKLELWSPDSPKLYDIIVESASDKVEDRVGFRSIETQGADILLNGKPIFLKGINIHEEIARDRRRSINKHDAEYLIGQAEALGCNFIRLSHYPQNEAMVKLCEERGIMMWEEIPVWQDINFRDKDVCDAATKMMHEMVERDKNRCGIIIWSVSNETFPYKERNEYLYGLIEKCRTWDDTRMISAAIDKIRFMTKESTDLEMFDPLADHLDIIGINKYMGWYEKWRKDPKDTKWISRDNKPVIISEFGAEAIYANYGDGDNLNSWSEEYMSKAYRDDLASFDNIPNLRGTAPWILFDFRSPRRAHAMYQQGWNRKGLLSPEGNRKQAWYIMRDYYKTK